MKRVLFVLGMLLTFGLFCACSSDDDITDVYEGQTSGSSKNENKGKKMLEVWELRTFDKCWGMITTFNPNEVVCRIYENNIIEVINKTDVNLSPFVNDGSYYFKTYTKEVTEYYFPKGSSSCVERKTTKDFFSVNGIEFEYWKDEDGILHLGQNINADGERYDFVKIQ